MSTISKIQLNDNSIHEIVPHKLTNGTYIANLPELITNTTIATTETENIFSKKQIINNSFAQGEKRIGEEGTFDIEATGIGSHAEGHGSSAKGDFSHAEGGPDSDNLGRTISFGKYSHAEGESTLSEGEGSHAEGEGTHTIGRISHTEGLWTESHGNYSHAEGSMTHAVGDGSHTEGVGTIANGAGSHAEGLSTVAETEYSHAEGLYTKTAKAGQFVTGAYNAENSDALFIIGNGQSEESRSNILEVTPNNVFISGDEVITQTKQNAFIYSDRNNITNEILIENPLPTKDLYINRIYNNKEIQQSLIKNSYFEFNSLQPATTSTKRVLVASMSDYQVNGYLSAVDANKKQFTITKEYMVTGHYRETSTFCNIGLLSELCPNITYNTLYYYNLQLNPEFFGTLLICMPYPGNTPEYANIDYILNEGFYGHIFSIPKQIEGFPVDLSKCYLCISAIDGLERPDIPQDININLLEIGSVELKNNISTEKINVTTAPKANDKFLFVINKTSDSFSIQSNQKIDYSTGDGELHLGKLTDIIPDLITYQNPIFALKIEQDNNGPSIVHHFKSLKDINKEITIYSEGEINLEELNCTYSDIEWVITSSYISEPNIPIKIFNFQTSFLLPIDDKILPKTIENPYPIMNYQINNFDITEDWGNQIGNLGKIVSRGTQIPTYEYCFTNPAVHIEDKFNQFPGLGNLPPTWIITHFNNFYIDVTGFCNSSTLQKEYSIGMNYMYGSVTLTSGQKYDGSCLWEVIYTDDTIVQKEQSLTFDIKVHQVINTIDIDTTKQIKQLKFYPIIVPEDTSPTANPDDGCNMGSLFIFDVYFNSNSNAEVHLPEPYYHIYEGGYDRPNLTIAEKNIALPYYMYSFNNSYNYYGWDTFIENNVKWRTDITNFIFYKNIIHATLNGQENWTEITIPNSTKVYFELRKVLDVEFPENQELIFVNDNANITNEICCNRLDSINYNDVLQNKEGIVSWTDLNNNIIFIYLEQFSTPGSLESFKTFLGTHNIDFYCKCRETQIKLTEPVNPQIELFNDRSRLLINPKNITININNLPWDYDKAIIKKDKHMVSIFTTAKNVDYQHQPLDQFLDSIMPINETDINNLFTIQNGGQ